jgi:aminoglycoside phosphotransferase (APT) family kinase protein
MPAVPGDRLQEIRRLVARARPGHPPTTIALAGEGLDNVAYEVDSELIVRLHKEPDPALLQTEARTLELAASCVPPAVPRPLHADAALGALVYARLPGVPLLDLRDDLARLDLDRFGAAIGGFLTRLHGLAPAAYEAFASHDPPDPGAWLAAARRLYERHREHVPADADGGAIEAFLRTPPPPASPHAGTFCHNDLGIEHVLVDPATLEVGAIIDWTDAAIADPAYDLALVHRDLGAAALERVVAHYGAAREPLADLRARAEFYARAQPLRGPRLRPVGGTRDTPRPRPRGTAAHLLQMNAVPPGLAQTQPPQTKVSPDS